MLLKNLKNFCERHKSLNKTFADYLDVEELSVKQKNDILASLADILMSSEYAKDVSECFPQLLLILLSKAIDKGPLSNSNETDANSVHRLNCTIIGQLILLHPDVLGFTLQYFEENISPFEDVDKDDDGLPPAKKQKTHSLVKQVSDYDIVQASYNILQASPDHFKRKWNWSKFYKYLTVNDDKVKWTATKCIGIVLEMSECLRIGLAKTLMNDVQPFLSEVEKRERNTILESQSSSNETEELAETESSVVSVAGVLLTVFKNRVEGFENSLIPVPSMEENLRCLALAVASRKCICLQGSVGCGKTAIVEYLAKITGHGPSDFIKVQLGDQTDSKMLLGTYRCTDIPGEFVWQPGVLTQAVMAGKWLLLEDIDSAALDVASVLSSLMETGTLSVPGYKDTIHVKSGFQLFVTQRLIPTMTGFQRQTSGAASLMGKHWLCVNMEPLTESELVTVVQTLFPVLSTIATRMVAVFLLFSCGNHQSETENEEVILKTGRLISTRDLMKWCSRAAIDFKVSSPESALKLFQDAIDIFCCSVSNLDQRMALAVSIGNKLGIIKTKAEYFCTTHKPSISSTPEYFIGGRSKLAKKPSLTIQLERSMAKYSFTRPSACLLERVACCVSQNEPVLLVGETGTGKTSSVQYLARSTGHTLVVINMNQQSESADLLGGYKPVDIKFLMFPIREEFELLFRSYFALEPNKKFLSHIGACYQKANWRSLLTLMSTSTAAAIKRMKPVVMSYKDEIIQDDRDDYSEEARKRQCLRRWEKLAAKLEKLSSQVKPQLSLAFSFIEGSLIKALKEGHWVLLDEINLASAETLECLSGLLEGSSGSLSLLERGDRDPVKRHPDFTMFACMNPATDVGKKELPIGLRNRFTEFYVDELIDKSDLLLLVGSYLDELNLPPARHEAIVKFYLKVRDEACWRLFDGTAHKPHYSLRTLCRALSVAASNPCGNVHRSLYEALCLSFLTQLDSESYKMVHKLIMDTVLEKKTAKSIVNASIPKPRCSPGEDYIEFEGYWVSKGTDAEPEAPKNYILTESVRRNLRDVVRVVSIGRMPVLLQGDTSVGKTSLISYLAKASGNRCLRINNHEHTDLQEYVGNYVADAKGRLVFSEGVLVEAMRKGYWIILDELNLAPSDVLEALNRVLDDNRELFIPETQETVKAHPNFMLFATQNPPGVYGGRKVLSRAFRNRFVELHFDELPASELQIILHERCSMPQSYCQQIIAVMTDLQVRRKSTAAFAGKHGFITLRDLFRWGERYRLAPDVEAGEFYDWSQHLADEGYLVLAAKVRRPEEANEIREVIKKHLKRDVDPENLFTLSEKTSSVTRSILEDIQNNEGKNPNFSHVVWTYHTRRMAVLVRKSYQFKEPVLLVGETGGGKTTVCQLMAESSSRKLHVVNCHMHTESSDFLGNLRPVRSHDENENQKLFEWVDGPLIKAMQKGDFFLADEISLADDSVLERLNSLLEPERSLLLAEKGIDDSSDANNTIVAHKDFFFVGTMNPGGDYGKKELSPALRNRFTEIWCDGCHARDDMLAIVKHNLVDQVGDRKEQLANAILSFVEWLPLSDVGKRLTVSIRDVLGWVNFINTSLKRDKFKLKLCDAYFHGACVTYLDSLGSGLTSMESPEKLRAFKEIAFAFLNMQTDLISDTPTSEESMEVDTQTDESTDGMYGMSPFYINKGANIGDELAASFTFLAPTTQQNTLKLLRALQLRKPILLEGSPGVGKTSLVSALAKASGHTCTRINLSDQTDVSDLFGADLPVEGGKGGEFAWKDGPFLRALRAGHWILLDELNLASQSVLEGLNACFDHRGEVYIPELGKTFSVKPETKLFACQNPLRQGGARRGLPKSFLNRFSQVFVDALTDTDLKFIVLSQFPQIDDEIVDRMIEFNARLSREAGVSWAFYGAPWEMNLRDITRWCEATAEVIERDADGEFFCNPGGSVELIYVDRMRTKEDKNKVKEIFKEIFPEEKYAIPPMAAVHVTDEKVYLGKVALERTNTLMFNDQNLLLLRDQMSALKSLTQCVNMNWMSILVGGSGCGKSSVVNVLAQLAGQKLRSLVVNSAMDTTEILGGFEQVSGILFVLPKSNYD
ncbi:hypothetical protein QAD02_000867 [Eretmocerus hayati]|uniref:Uncharacterized protein n=1 Tax=Eretmocerus hayati TaxID=131215 RepID=A0ACC2NEL8_9HYME|nr:hypothetical protein QAD02_000867 [Eretmocerus hayati]